MVLLVVNDNDSEMNIRKTDMKFMFYCIKWD